MMDKISNRKIYSIIILLFIVIIGGGAFYWYEWRPAKIKHDCSWVKVVDPAVSEKPAITKNEAEESRRKYDDCIKQNEEKASLEKSLDNYIKTGQNIRKPFFSDLFCDNLLKQESPVIPAIPERAWYRKEFDKDKYNFCIHEKGL